MKNTKLINFATSHNVANHPLAKARIQTKQLYFSVLTYFLDQYKGDDEYTSERLLQYRTKLIGNAAVRTLTQKDCCSAIRSVLCSSRKSLPKEPGVWLMCDFALITGDHNAIRRAQEAISRFCKKSQCGLLSSLVDALFEESAIPRKLFFARRLIGQFRINSKFSLQPQMRVMITANMSAGKSTLINALIGKPLTRTSQEVCTANLCYLFDKPFEDNSIHLLTDQLNLRASHDDLRNSPKEDVSYIASYFRKLVSAPNRICLIDSPGVNSAMNHNHSEVTCKAIKGEKYDKLIYVLDAGKLATNDEMRYLKYISENVPKRKVIFVLNKLDNFSSEDDSISESVANVKSDLHKLGYKNPIICPLSAYCALLVKMKQNGDVMSKGKERAYKFYAEKFSEDEYDLSSYFHDDALSVPLAGDELLTLAIKCGIYGLESILYGGMF